MGLPVYKGADLIGRALDCLQRQTYGNFEAIISVDGDDVETAEACRPFLADPRFRIVVQPEQLDWVGNFNWLLQQDLKEFFCYRQHDDTTAPEFFEVLLQVADAEPDAAAVYCDCQYSGISKWLEISHSIKGPALERIFQHIERLPYASGAPVRGLIRRAAIRQAGLVRTDEFRAPVQLYGWLAKLLHWGNFERVAKPLYFRRDRAEGFTRKHLAWSEDRRLAAWTTMFTGLLEAAIPLCDTPEQRLFFQQAILGRVVAYPYFRPIGEGDLSGKLIDACLERLKHEGNTHLFSAEEFPVVIQGLERRLDEIKLTEKARLQKGIYEVRQQARLSRVIYPKSRTRRGVSQICHFVKMAKRQTTKWTE